MSPIALEMLKEIKGLHLSFLPKKQLLNLPFIESVILYCVIGYLLER